MSQSFERIIHRDFLTVAGQFSPRLAEAFAQVGPVRFRPNNAGSPAEHLCRSVAGQQLSVKAAGSIWRRVETAAGEAPLLEFLITGNAARLRECGLSASKVRTLCGIAGEHRNGGLKAAALRAMNHQERSRHLTALWGVGQWTADMISIFYFAEEDVWPEGDAAACRTLEQLAGPRRKVHRTALRFSPFRSRLAVYMWRFADSVPAV